MSEIEKDVLPAAAKTTDSTKRNGPVKRKVTTSLIRRVFLTQLAVIVGIIIFVVIGANSSERLFAFPIAFSCGAIGGSLALLKKIRAATIDTLKEIESSLVTTLMPFLYGGILAAVTYLFFISCILTGDGQGGLFTSNLFPEFKGLLCQGENADLSASLTMDTVLKIKPATTQDFAKLLVWCLLAGYWEKFVDQIFGTLTGRTAKK